MEYYKVYLIKFLFHTCNLYSEYIYCSLYLEKADIVLKNVAGVSNLETDEKVEKQIIERPNERCADILSIFGVHIYVTYIWITFIVVYI